MIGDLPSGFYEPCDPSLVVSSGHGFVVTLSRTDPNDGIAWHDEIDRTIAALHDGPVEAVEPHVWRARGHDMPIRLDGFGPNVPMNAELATAMAIDALHRPRLDDRGRRTIVAAAHTIASQERLGTRHVACMAPTPWRPACMHDDDSEIPSPSHFTGSEGEHHIRQWNQRNCRPLDPGLAVLLPRVTIVERGIVTTDDRVGTRLRPIGWSGRGDLDKDPMEAIRDLAELGAMLAGRDPDART